MPGGLIDTDALNFCGHAKQLQSELRRKDKALAETAALLVLQKKVQALREDPEDGKSS